MYLCLVLMMYTSSTAQSSFKNYVQTKTYLDNAGTTFLRHIDYYDELGYVAETVDVGNNTSQTPLVVKLDYSPHMPLSSQWAPVPATGLDYLNDVSYLARTTYNDTEAYSDYYYDDFKELESSKKPGVAWEDHIATITRNAVPAGAVRKYSVASNGSLHDDGMYPSGLLTSTTTTDEDGRSMTVYVNMHGNTILERRASDNDTYYVYDDYGRLKYVLPPMCQQCSTSQMSKYWYKYTYDDRGRCTEKQLPAYDEVQYWYDGADRIQSERDRHLRSQSLYRNYSYDAIGRLLLQTISSTRGEADQSNAVAVEIKNYYDDYSFRQEVAQLFPEWADSINAAYNSPMVARGRLTATLRYTSNTKGYFEMYRYDTDGRMTYKLSAYDDKWMKIERVAYNFVGDVVTEDERVYTYSDTHISLLAGRRTVNTYHPGTRLLANTTITHTDKNGNTSTQTVSSPTYDVFGNVIADNRPGTAADMAYTYDTLHGWLTGVSSPSGFSEQLQRETATNTQYGGNIGRMLWRNTANGEQHRYDYTYDSLGRLTSSQYSSSANGTAGRYNESVTYNPNGSIMSLLRKGMKNDGTFGAIDDLTITYDGNRLLKVTDDAEALNYNGALDFYDGSDEDCEYEYDGNGGLTKDKNKGITGITYDYGHNMYHASMVLPSVRGGVINDYNSDGRKLSSRHTIYTPTGHGGYNRIVIADLYIDGLILRGDTALLWKFNGGYVELNANGTPTCWNYYITDHLGSTRMVVGSDNSIKGTINYYPFGSEMKMEDPALLTGGTSHPYRFTGKELDKMIGLNMYDFGARWYDVAGVPMWTSVDPLAENYYNVTPYSYCAGEPVNRFDPDGNDYWSTNDINEIRNFLNALGSGQTQFDFSNWQHATDAEIVGNLTYNDETNIFYTSYSRVEDGEIVVVGKSFDAHLMPVSRTGKGYPGAFVYQPLEGFWQIANHFCNGTQYYDGEINWSANLSGRITGVAPIIGIVNVNTPAQKSKAVATLLSKGAKLCKSFGRKHGENVYKLGKNYYSIDNTSHNGGVYKVFKQEGGKLKRVGTADENLNIFKK